MTVVSVNKTFNSLPLTQHWLQQAELKATDDLLIKITKVVSLVLIPFVVVADLLHKCHQLIVDQGATPPSVPSSSWRSHGITLVKWSGLILTAVVIYQSWKFVQSNPSDTGHFLLGPDVNLKTPLPEIQSDVCPIMEPFKDSNIAKLLTHRLTEGVSMQDVDMMSDHSFEFTGESNGGPMDLPKAFTYSVRKASISLCDRYTPIRIRPSADTSISFRIREVLHSVSVDSVSDRFRRDFNDPFFAMTKNLLETVDKGFAFLRKSGGSSEIAEINLLCLQSGDVMRCAARISSLINQEDGWTYEAQEINGGIHEHACPLSYKQFESCISASSDQGTPTLLNRFIYHFTPLREYLNSSQN